jgi:hypothetical protein
MSMHIIEGKETTHGDIVHYTDHAGTSHAALIKNLKTDPTSGAVHAHLHVFSSTNDSDYPLVNVPHNPSPATHTWTHKK